MRTKRRRRKSRRVERLRRLFPDEVEYHRDDDFVVTCPTRLCFVPTPIDAVIRILEHLDPEPGTRVVDLGCGDGRFVAAAAYLYGCRGIGVDVREDVLQVARRKCETLGVEDKTVFIRADVREVDLRGLRPDIVFVYLLPSLLRELSDDLAACDATIVSYTFPIDSLGPPKVLKLDERRRAYVYER